MKGSNDFKGSIDCRDVLKGTAAVDRDRTNIAVIMTPNLDALAAAGLRFSQFYNTAEPTSQLPQTQIKGIIQP